MPLGHSLPNRITKTHIFMLHKLPPFSHMPASHDSIVIIIHALNPLMTNFSPELNNFSISLSPYRPLKTSSFAIGEMVLLSKVVRCMCLLLIFTRCIRFFYMCPIFSGCTFPLCTSPSFPAFFCVCSLFFFVGIGGTLLGSFLLRILPLPLPCN